MGIRLPVYTYVGVDEFQMYPGRSKAPGIHHDLVPGLHLVAGVNGLGKSTFLLLLYHGLVGPAALRNDDFGRPQPEVVPDRDVDKFRRRVADAARNGRVEVRFTLGTDLHEVVRALHNLSLITWRVNGAELNPEEEAYQASVAAAMNVGTFADVLLVLNLIVFMFEGRSLLMWNQAAQRNALRVLFMEPAEANLLAERGQAVTAANSAYRNLLVIVNRDRRQLERDQAALAAADGLGAEYASLQGRISDLNFRDETLSERLRQLDDERTRVRSALETARFNYDDALREIEALGLARVAAAFPSSEESSRYVISRLLGDGECMACGADGGPLAERWATAVAAGSCAVCGAERERQETVVSATEVDAARLARAEERLTSARQAVEASEEEAKVVTERRDGLQAGLDRISQERSDFERRVRQIAGSLPPPSQSVQALANRVSSQSEVLERLRLEQAQGERAFSEVFGRFSASVVQKAEAMRERFGRRISDFLVERAEIALSFVRAPVGESGQSFEWPTFSLSMTSGTYEAPAPRRTRSEVSMSQGEFIDLSFRLALVETATEAEPATMVFDAPEASLDALFMRRAGAFLAQFTRDNSNNRLIVTSNLTNADMIPALFGAYEPQAGDPAPSVIPRADRRARVINLLELAKPTSAVTLVGDRYRDLLDRALFPPGGEAQPGL